MRTLLLAALLLSACAGRDTPAGAWVFGHEGRKQGDRTMWSSAQEEFADNPQKAGYAAGSVIGAVIRLLILKVASP